MASRDLNIRLNENVAASRAQKRNLLDMWKKIERFQTGDHWNIKWHQLIQDEDRVFPSVQLSWMITDQMKSRIFDRPLKPVITAEQPVNYPLPDNHPWKQIVNQVRQLQLFDEETDSEIAAQLMSNIVDYEWDAARIEEKNRELVDLGLWYGTGVLLDGYDDFELTLGEKTGVFVDTIHPRDFYVDTMASNLNDARWCAYVTLRSMDWIEERWPDKAKEVADELGASKKDEAGAGSDRFEILQSFENPDRDENENKVLETHFIRDFSTESREIELDTGNFEDVVSELTGLPVTDQVGTAMQREIKDKGIVRIPNFRAGWRVALKVGDVTLNGEKSEQELDSPNGKLPLHVFRPWRAPRQFWGMGSVENTRHLNFLLDKSLKYAVENANRTSNNQLIIDESLIEDIDDLYTNERGGIKRGSFGGKAKQAVIQFPAMNLPAAHVQMINLLRELTDNVTGITDLRFRQNMPQDASGRFVEALEQGSNSRLGIVRKELSQCVIHPLTHNIIAQNIDKADMDRIIKITRSFMEQPAYVEFNPTILAFEDQDFEAKFDVETPADDAQSVSPQAQDAQTVATIKELATLGPDLAADTLRVINVPNKKAIEKALFKFFRSQAAQAQQGQQADPAQTKMIADQNEALSQIVRRTGESTADAVENLAKEIGKDRPDLADALINAMPEMVSANVTQVIRDLSGALGTPTPGPQQIVDEVVN